MLAAQQFPLLHVQAHLRVAEGPRDPLDHRANDQGQLVLPRKGRAHLVEELQLPRLALRGGEQLSVVRFALLQGGLRALCAR